MAVKVIAIVVLFIQVLAGLLQRKGQAWDRYLRPFLSSSLLSAPHDTPPQPPTPHLLPAVENLLQPYGVVKLKLFVANFVGPLLVTLGYYVEGTVGQLVALTCERELRTEAPRRPPADTRRTCCTRAGLRRSGRA